MHFNLVFGCEVEERKLMNEEEAQRQKIRGFLVFHCFLLPKYTNTKEDKRRLKSEKMFFPRHISTAAHLLTVPWFKGCSLLQINSIFYEEKRFLRLKV